MARTDQDGPKAQDNDGTEIPQEEADGYRPSRRQLARSKEASRPPGKDREQDKPAPGNRPANRLDEFLEQHWEAWLRPVVLLVLLGAGVLGYRWDLISETVAGLLAAGGILGVTIYATARPVLKLIEARRNRILFGGLVVVWAISSGFPALRKAVPRSVLAEAVLTEQNMTAQVHIPGSTGPFDMTVSGKIMGGGAQQVEATYEVVVTAPGGASATVEGSLEYSVHQTRSRRGTTHWTEKHDRNEHRLPSSLRSNELTLSTERIDTLLQDGLHILIHPRDPLLPFFMPTFGGVATPVLGLLVVLIMIFLETRIGDAENKPYLVMASLTTLVFSWRFSLRATPTNLVAPAVEALFVSLILGGMGGSLIGWIARRLSGRSKLKPARRDGNRGRHGAG
ncbi:MAG: hypothetical protein RMK29_13630 [Myxococcales bacterium]|nr:hypothetical protein [Myxococcota bacterium]MDW8282749.1 hypothetical protein [Myxococcales bacterium]